ncbi:unnamed protein product [Rhizophagus irregularis]|nr:unnamed protein product [Rhizophagus irregularis]
MSSELEVLKQRIFELEAKNAELEAEKAELLKRIMEENTRRDVRVEELEQKNKELETRLAIVEQASLPVEEQTYNDNPSDNSTSNFNSVTEYHEKPLVDVETDNSFPEEVCYNKQEPLEEKDMDSFLLEAHKKIVSDEIRQRKREEKLQRESTVASPSYNSEKDDRVISEISGEFEKTVPSGNDQSHVTSGEPDLLSVEQDDDMIQEESLDENQIVEQGLIHELCSSILPEDNVSSTEIISSCVSLENLISGSAQHLSYLFETAIKSSQQEILDWYNYSFEFESKVDALMADDQVKKYTSDHQSHMTLIKTVPSGNDQIKAEVSTSANVLSVSSSSQSKPTYDRSYFCNKTLDQYPNLYREFSSENFDYYGITDEKLCPLCKLEHGDEESIED